MGTKYVLIEGGEEYKNTAVELKVAQDMIAKGKAVSYSPITLKEIKEKRIHIYQTKHYIEHMQHEALVEKYNEKVFTATVLWFNKSSGEGMVKINETSVTLPIYACNIKGRRTWYPQTACVYYEPNQVIDVQCSVFAGGQVFVNGLTEGIQDNEAWDRIKDKDLAFRCDENGKAINGLFK